MAFLGPFLLMCCLPWITGVIGLWVLVDHRSVGFDPRWTEKKRASTKGNVIVRDATMCKFGGPAPPKLSDNEIFFPYIYLTLKEYIYIDGPKNFQISYIISLNWLQFYICYNFDPLILEILVLSLVIVTYVQSSWHCLVILSN
jgi:hypothetical protein